MAAGYNKKEHAFRQFNTDLKADNFGPVLFMYGVEDYLTEWAAESLVKRYVNPGSMAMDYVKLDESESADSVLEACDTFPFFSEKKVVWAKDFPLLKSVSPKGFTQSDTDKLLQYINNPNPAALLILSCEKAEEKSPLVKELKKKCTCYDFDKLDYGQLAAFAEKRFKAAGKIINKDTLRYLIDETGYFNKETEYRIFNLENDIKKIISYSDDERVTEEDVSATLNGDLDTFVFNFLDAVSSNKKDIAFGLLHNILASGTDVFSIIGLLVNHFELILEVKEFKQDGAGPVAITGIMKIHEFRVKKAMSFSDKFTMEKIRSILIQLYETDRNIKTGVIDQHLALELLVGRI